MRISMWMLANQLINFDPEIHIQNNAPVTLKNVRRSYGTNCVHVYQEGKNVVCAGEGDHIILKNMDADVAFEIVQSIFDYYDDWKTSVINVAAQHDYETLLNVSQQIFHNPMLIISPNHKVIAMSNYDIDEDQDDEWNYLRRYGYSSYTVAQMLYDNPVQRKQCQATTPQIMKFPKDAHKSNCLSTNVYYDNINCGRLTILEVKRKLNVGDIQLTSILTSLISPYMYHYVASNVIQSIDNPIANMLKGNRVKDAEIERWIKYKKWNRDDNYRIIILTRCHNSQGNTVLPLLNNLIEQNVAESETFTVDNCLVTIVNQDKVSFAETRKFIANLAEDNNYYMGISLSYSEISKTADYFSQARAAVEYGILFEEKKLVFDFYNYAMYYLMEQSDISLQISALHPDIRHIWQMKSDIHVRDKLETMACYLRNERSLVKTAEERFVHRNTLIYRLKKITSEMEYDIEDSYTRSYFIHSMEILGLYLKKYSNTQTGLEDTNLYYYPETKEET